jgi:hypothetical protein
LDSETELGLTLTLRGSGWSEAPPVRPKVKSKARETTTTTTTTTTTIQGSLKENSRRN